MAESGNRTKDEARLQKIIRELDRMIDAICDGVPAERVKDRMIAMEAERIEIEQRLEAEPKEDKPLLHPSMGGRYRKAVTDLRESLANQSAQHEAVEILRSLIDRIVLHPDAEEASGFVMDIEGDLAGILSLCHISKKAAGLSPDDLMQIKLVAGARSGHDLPEEQMKLVAGTGLGKDLLAEENSGEQIKLVAGGRSNLNLRTKDGHSVGVADLRELASQVETVARVCDHLNLLFRSAA